MEERTRNGARRWIYGVVSAAAVVLLVGVGVFAVAYPSPTTRQRFESPESVGQSYATADRLRWLADRWSSYLSKPSSTSAGIPSRRRSPST